MPTYWTQTLIPTARQVPAEAEVPSHQLMLRAGLIRKLGAGIYDYLPLGLRSLRKAMAIVHDEMDRAGAIEVMLPTLQPIELWEQTGRNVAYGDNLLVVTDRHGRKQALGPTHEEVMTELVSGYIESYKQLPLTLYQIQTKFRDEFRPRFGVLRSREFQMKDAYSFHLTLDGPGGLDETYQKQFDAYCRIFSRCGLPYEIVEAEAGPIGGNASHEFMVPSPTGEDVILKSSSGKYAANVEKCEIGTRANDLKFNPTGALEDVHTPHCSSIDDVMAFFKKELKTKLKSQNMLKTLVCKAGKLWLVAIVRGDHELNVAKLRAVCGMPEIALADDAEARNAGFVIGFVGPHVAVNRNDVLLVVDPDAAQSGFWVTGGNKADHHVKHFDWQREVITARGRRLWKKLEAAWEKKPGFDHTSALSGQKEWKPDEEILIADIRNAVDGDPAPDGGTLEATKGIEIGHVFKLGDKYSKAMDVTVLDENNQRSHPIMGCYGIGVNRILAAAIERDGGHDDNGIVWPAAIAPFAVLITPIKFEGAVRETAERIAGELELFGLDVLIDDREERPGVKFKDADLIGIPVRITIGDKALANGQVEVKHRTAAKPELVAVAEAAEHTQRCLANDAPAAHAVEALG